MIKLVQQTVKIKDIESKEFRPVDVIATDFSGGGSDKMDVHNPMGYGEFRLISDEDVNCSIAIGDYSNANGLNSAAFGTYNEANGTNSFVAGDNNIVNGESSFVEGNGNKADGYCSHAEGTGTISSGEYQHVQGQYNEEDTENKYAHIIGAGSYFKRKNIHTVDWNGNAFYAGDVIAMSADGEEISLRNVWELVQNIPSYRNVDGEGF